jgi:pyruvate/2-oxoglutarate dehydrogenase complex dihydrolipoamide acyltransferase (E2) component
MATEVIIPILGELVEDVTILQWFKSEGDLVEKGESLLEVEAQKVTVEIESPASGIVGSILYEERSKVPIAQVVAVIVAEGEAVPETYKKPSAEGTVHAATPLPPKKSLSSTQQNDVRVAPIAQKIAEKHGIDLSLVKGSGPRRTIMKKDVEAYMATAQKQAEKRKGLERARTGEMAGAAVERGVSLSTHSSSKDFPGKELRETIPITGVRRVIFDNMFMSLSHTAQLTMHTEASAEAFVTLRDRLNQGVSDPELRVSYNAILVKIAATALQLHPAINASVHGDEIEIWQQIHIGVAMESDDALVVPVIRNPEQKTITEINRNLSELIARTREKRLTPDDLANGTFTISNLGFADVDFFTPILRPPESALLGVGRIVEKPVIKDGAVTAERRISLSLTFDHRIIDGAPGARFLKTIKETLEDPLLLVQ